MATDPNAFSLLQLQAPLNPRHRRGQPPPFVRRPDDLNAHAELLHGAVQVIRNRLRGLTDEQKQVVYLKLTTQMDLSPNKYAAVGLRPVAWRGNHVTVVITDEEKLRRFLDSVDAVQAESSTSAVRDAVFNITEAPVLIPMADRVSNRLGATLDVFRTQTTLDLVLHVYPQASDYANVDTAVQAAVQAVRDRIKRAGILAGLGVQDVVHYVGDEFAEVRVRINTEILDEFLTEPLWNCLLWLDLPARPDFIVGIPFDADVEDVVKEVPPVGAPLLCVIDSGIASGHPLLAEAIAENPGPFDARLPHQHDEVIPAGHGTGVAGIALYYQLEDHWARRLFSPAGFLANARITDHSNTLLNAGGAEKNHKLLATLLRDIVTYFAPLGCRIFNLSVCDRDRPFHHGGEDEQSLVAATIDRLSKEYDVLFVVSAGNIMPTDVTWLHQDAPYPNYLMRRDISDNRILDPAQALTALTIGSVSQEDRIGLPGRRPDRAALGTPGLVSPFSRTGPGIAGAIKPDLVEVGGNYAWDTYTHEALFDPRLGLSTLATSFIPGVSPGAIAEPFQKMVGTSVSAPRISRLALAVLDYLDPSTYPSSDLIRAFLTHSAEPLPGVIDWFRNHPDFERKRSEWVNLTGYGKPDLDRLFRINSQRYVAVFDSGLEQAMPLFHENDRTQRGSVAMFKIPIPSILRQTGNSTKRLTVTLAFRPKVKHSRLRTYPGVRMAWEVFRSDVNPDLVWDYMAHSEDEDGPNIKPDIPNRYRLDTRATFKRQRRSRGTLQHDYIEWKGHLFGNAEADMDDFLLAVAARPNWETMPVNEVQPYALVVSLELIPSKPQHEVDIYELVKARLPVRIVVPVRLPVRV